MARPSADTDPGAAARPRSAAQRGGAEPTGWLTLPRFLLASGVAIGLLAVAPALTDPDYWWHLRTGQILLRTHRLITTAPYTFTALHHHWVLQEWLTEIWYAALNHTAGRAGIVVLFELATAAMLAAVLLRARLVHPVGSLALALGAVLMMLAGAPVWGPRPQMETYVLLAVTLYLAERQLRLGGRAALGLPLVFLLWSNLEAGWVVGWAFLVVIVGVEAGRGWLGGREGPDPADIRRLAVGTGAATLALLVNPNGPSILLYPFQTQFDTVQQTLIQEWHSPDFSLVALWPLLLLLLSLPVLLLRYRRCGLRDACLLLLATPLALQSVRQTAIFALVATPVWIVQVDAAAHQLGTWRGRRPGRTRRMPPPIRAMAALELLVIVLALATRVGAAATPAEGSSFYTTRFPVCAAAWLERAPGGLRLFDLYGDGGYLLDHVRQDRVYIFGDAAFMGNAYLLRFARIADLAPGWLAALDRTRSQLVVYERGTPLDLALERVASWRLVYRDRRMDVFARAGLLPRLRLPPVPSPGGWRRAGLAGCIAQRPRR